MADPKYAGLPGIVYDQPDIFETNDLPESEQDYCEVENADSSPSIEVLHISGSDAHKRFKGKVLDSTHVDFSDRISSRLRTGFSARRVEWDVSIEDGEEENLVQKYQRLQLEVDQLQQEVQQIKSPDYNFGDGKVCIADLSKQVDSLHSTILNLNLQETLGPEIMQSISEPHAALQKKLVNLLESFKKTGLVAEKKEGKVDPKKCGTSASQSGALTYELHYTPEHAKLNQLSKASLLEKKLDKLEALVGNNPDKMSSLCTWTNHKNLTSAVNVLSSRLALLDPSHLDHIEGRLHTVHTKMNNIAEKKAAVADADKESKVNELYDLMKKTEVLCSALPDIVTRLVCTEGLHQEATQFSRSLKQLDVSQTQMNTLLQNNSQLLSDIQDKFLSNLTTIKNNISALDERINKLPKK